MDWGSVEEDGVSVGVGVASAPSWLLRSAYSCFIFLVQMTGLTDPRGFHHHPSGTRASAYH